MAGKLFQEFIVDSWASTEQARLNYIRDHQADIRSETYRGFVREPNDSLGKPDR